jgi:Fe-S-cluster-containing dehydrogenase component
MDEEESKSGFSRRDLLKIVGGAGVGIALSGALWLEDGIAAIPASRGYLLVDLKKCAGCLNCMLACSLAHEGKVNLSRSRIQVLQNSFAHVPDDLTVAQCRQCVSPACLEACPTGALHPDSKQGNIRVIDVAQCIGCRSCLEACSFAPGRVVWNPETNRAAKCDLCAEAPFWNQQGGPEGKQACIEICPRRALRFTEKIPPQQGDKGYILPR